MAKEWRNIPLSVRLMLDIILGKSFLFTFENQFGSSAAVMLSHYFSSLKRPSLEIIP